MASWDNAPIVKPAVGSAAPAPTSSWQDAPIVTPAAPPAVDQFADLPIPQGEMVDGAFVPGQPLQSSEPSYLQRLDSNIRKDSADINDMVTAAGQSVVNAVTGPTRALQGEMNPEITPEGGVNSYPDAMVSSALDTVGLVAGNGPGMAGRGMMAPDVKLAQQAAALATTKAADEFGIPLTQGQAQKSLTQITQEELLRQGDGQASTVMRNFDETQRDAIGNAVDKISANAGQNPGDVGPTVMNALNKVVADTKAGAENLYDRAFGGNLNVDTNAVKRMPDTIASKIAAENAYIDTAEVGSITPVSKVAMRIIDEAVQKAEASIPRRPNTVTNKAGVEFLDTRGSGQQYHGSSNPIDQFDEGHYNNTNIYGNGFYTTDAADIANGYRNKGGGGNPNMYSVSEKNPVKLADMDQPFSAMPENLRKLAQSDDMLGQALEQVDKPNPTLRDVLDELRFMSASEGWSRDDVQEMLSTVQYNLEEAGFGGMKHVGGTATDNTPHNVQIYFRPWEDVNLKQADASAFQYADPEVVTSLKEIENIRRRLVALDADTMVDRRALASIKSGFDDWVSNTVDQALISGDDAALEALKQARAQWSEYKGLSTAKTGDSAMQSVVKMQKQDATAEEVANWLYGADVASPSLAAPKVAQRVKAIVGPDSDAWGAVRAAAVERLTKDLATDTPRTPLMISKRIDQFLNSKGETLSRVLFSNEERDALQRFSDTLKTTVTPKDATNPSRTASTLLNAGKKLSGQLGGVAGTVVGGPALGIAALLAVPIFKNAKDIGAAMKAVTRAAETKATTPPPFSSSNVLARAAVTASPDAAAGDDMPADAPTQTIDGRSYFQKPDGTWWEVI